MAYTKVVFKSNLNLGNMEFEHLELTYEFDNNVEDVVDVYYTVREDTLGLLNEAAQERLNANKSKTRKKR